VVGGEAAIVVAFGGGGAAFGVGGGGLAGHPGVADEAGDVPEGGGVFGA